MTDLTGWSTRKPFTVNNSGSTLTNYATKFTINRSTGSDSGYVVYVSTSCESDYDDIRFVKNDSETLLDYWIESATTGTATVWVEFDSLANGDNEFYLYYGNAAASAVSNMDNTFPFGDMFETYTGTPEPMNVSYSTKWSNVSADSGVPSISQTTCTAYQGTYCQIVRPSVAAPITSIGKLRTSSTFVCPSGKIYYYLYSQHANSRAWIRLLDSSNNELTSQEITDSVGSWGAREFDISAYAGQNVKIQIEGGTAVGTSGYFSAFDKMIVRLYTATAPTITTWGSEEQTPIRLVFISEFDINPIVQKGFIYVFDENQGDSSFIGIFSVSPPLETAFVSKFDILIGIDFIGVFDSGKTETTFIGVYDNQHGNAGYILLNVFSPSTTNSWYSNNGGNY